MRVWRVAVGANGGLDGEGARLYGGRWNSEGTALVYAATHLSLAILEVLVHVPPNLWPDQTQAFSITLPEGAVIDNLEDDDMIPTRPEDYRSFGDGWVVRGRAQAIRVPSVIVPRALGSARTDEANVLLNPAFAADWHIDAAPFRLDQRLRRRD